MQAVLLKEFGGPEVMYLGQAPQPKLQDGQVLIKVYATSVNRPDIVQRQGNYAPPKGDSEILGLEVAGVVEQIGESETRWKPGDRVFALIGGGGYAEYAAAYSGHMMKIPEHMSFIEAACICETYLTAYLNVFLLGGFTDGQAVLLHGGGGGVNTAAIQLCCELCNNARIIVTASPTKLDRVIELGAGFVIDYTSESFADRVKEITSGAGVDVILDHIGAPYLTPNMKCLAVGGRLVEIGVTGGIKAELNIALMMVKRQQIIGSVLRPRSVAEKLSIIDRFHSAVMPLFEQARIKPLVSHRFPLEEAQQAHELMESSQHFGKIVLEVCS